jgi:hypothetical protein
MYNDKMEKEVKIQRSEMIAVFFIPKNERSKKVQRSELKLVQAKAQLANVNIVTDLDGKKFVLINDIRFKAEKREDWKEISV